MYLHRATTTTFPSKWHVAGRHTLLLLAPDQVKYRLMSTANKTWAGYTSQSAGASYLDILAAVTSSSTLGANIDLPVSALIGGSGAVSDMAPTYVANSFGSFEINTSNSESLPNDGKPITLNSTDIGLDDEVGSQGSAVFHIYLDGVKVFDSGTMRGDSETKKVSIDVTGRHELRLVMTDAGDGADYDHAGWANPTLTKVGMNWSSVNWSSDAWGK